MECARWRRKGSVAQGSEDAIGATATAVAWWGVTSVPEIRLDILDKFWTLRLCLGVYGGVWTCTKVIK